ncbi:hypothetical protein AAHW25_10485 [Klebsiella pneumoniae]|uniref:hypothetical protein n=1 Tax=Klebsiella pneumoniae TaxID=573 RepID=UPI0022EB3D4A|nr:hypothetical protein [Klebsiella pneumoniae]MDA3142441.1 hypothetical protein [Klebsiella pneumoniae]HDY8985484.1 hypothetical protein [Klebsiella pneumoniae]
MKKSLIALVLLCPLAANAAGGDYTLNCHMGKDNKTLTKLDLIDTSVINFAILGGEDHLKDEQGYGIFQQVGGVNYSGVTVNVYAHSTFSHGKALHVDDEVGVPVNSWDSFEVTYSGNGASREYRIIDDDGNHTCDTVKFSAEVQKK